MSENNVELARHGYEAALRGDIAVIREMLDPDVRWHGGAPAAPGSCNNRDEALAFLRQARARRGAGELIDVIDAGDKVVVVVTRPPRVDGEPVTLSANVTSFRDGKVTEIVHYANPDDALAAARS
jgi:ketosteroid isomerase-like protein